MYFVRWTPINLTKFEYFTYLSSHFQDVLVSEEYSKRHKRHFHALLRSPLDQIQSSDALRKRLYVDLLEDGQRKGAPTLDIKEISLEDEDHVATYTVKDKDILYTDYFKDKVEKYIENSYSKQTPTQMIEKRISEELESERPDFRQLAWDITLITATHMDRVYPAKIEALVLRAMINHDHNHIDRKVLSRFKIFDK